jgi:hypothetical protein
VARERRGTGRGGRVDRVPLPTVKQGKKGALELGGDACPLSKEGLAALHAALRKGKSFYALSHEDWHCADGTARRFSSKSLSYWSQRYPQGDAAFQESMLGGGQ